MDNNLDKFEKGSASDVYESDENNSNDGEKHVQTMHDCHQGQLWVQEMEYSYTDIQIYIYFYIFIYIYLYMHT